MTFVTATDRAVFAPGGRALRDYQVEAVDAVTTAHATGTLRPAVVLPTGTGKSTVIARLALETMRRGQRAVLMAHRGELMDQLRDSVHAVAGESGLVGIVQADRDEVDKPILAAMVQTIRQAHRLERLENVGLVVVDEAHRAAADSYQTVLAGLGCFSHTPAAGFTATLSRGDDRNLADTWEEVVFSRSIRWAIDAGHLVEPRGKAIVLEDLDLDTVKRTGGDFQDGDLGELIGAHAAAIAETWRNHAADRKTMVFVPSVESAYEVAAALEDAGATPAVVVGTTPRHERDVIYAAFRDGELNVLVSVAVLTEGFDEPSVDCVLMARPTGLHHIYIQAAGRGLRPSPTTGKTDCLILDVVGVSHRFPLTTLEDLDPDVEYTRAKPNGDEIVEEEEPIGDGPGEDKAVRHRVDLVDVDLFRVDEDYRWLRTHRGTRFRPYDGKVAFVWPAGEDVDGEPLYVPGVIRAVKPYAPAKALSDVPLRLEDAKAAVATIAEFEYWRALSRPRGGRPSQALLNRARRLGIPRPERFTAPALSDATNIVVASALLDR